MRSIAQLSNLADVTYTTPLTVAQVAELAEMPKRTVQYAIARGRLRAHKLPGATGAYLIDPDELDIWLAERTKASA